MHAKAPFFTKENWKTDENGLIKVYYRMKKTSEPINVYSRKNDASKQQTYQGQIRSSNLLYYLDDMEEESMW